MKKIKLHGRHGKGKFALVDKDDFESLNQWRWHLSTQGYVKRSKNLGNGKWKWYFMHSCILKVPNGFENDHKNRNKLDNRKANLRICTKTQNIANRVARSKSGYKGVKKCSKNSWRAMIQRDNKMVYLGSYKSPEEAALAYDMAAATLHGEFACLNLEQ